MFKDLLKSHFTSDTESLVDSSIINTVKCIFLQTASGCDCRPCRRQVDSSQEIFDSIDFYLGRFTRILPVYYFCMVVGIVLIPFGHSYSAPENILANVGGTLLSIFLVQIWVMNPFTGFGPNGPAWTVSTLFFFYLVYPR